MRYILHDHIGSANHGCEALVRTVSKLLGPGRTVLLSEAPEEDARYGVARPARCAGCAPRAKRCDPQKLARILERLSALKAF